MTHVQKLRDYFVRSETNKLLFAFNSFRNQKFELPKTIVSVSQRVTLLFQVNNTRILAFVAKHDVSLLHQL